MENADTLCHRCHKEWHECEGWLDYHEFLWLPPATFLLKIQSKHGFAYEECVREFRCYKQTLARAFVEGGRNAAAINKARSKLSRAIVSDTSSMRPDVGSFMPHIYATLAERERGMISNRTKEGLNAARARGVVLGNAETAAANAAKAKEFAEGLRDIVWPIRSRSSRQIARFLNDRDIATRQGKRWESSTVLRLISRLMGTEDHMTGEEPMAQLEQLCPDRNA